jgi:serine phosphatase RsbU (regulator of sigma subunit)
MVLRMNSFWQIISFCWCCLWGSALLGQTPVVGKLGKQNITAYVQVFADTTNQMSISEIASLQNEFATYAKDEFNFNRIKTNYWLRIAIQGDSTRTNDEYFLQISYPLVDEIDFYYALNDGQWHRLQAGDMRPFNIRLIEHRTALFPVRISPATQTCYIRLYSETTTNTRLNLIEKSAFYEILQKEELGYGVFFGVLLLIVFNNLLYFFYIKDWGYLWYISFVLANLVFQASLSGHVFQYFLTDAAGWQNKWVAVFTTSGVLMGVAFAFVFLDIRRYSVRTFRITVVAMLFQCLMLLASILAPYYVIMPAIKALSLLSVIFLIVVAFMVWRKGNQAARFYLAAYCFYLIFAAAFILKTSNILPENFVTVHGFEIAILLESITLSIALADKTRLERNRIEQEKKEAQLEALRIQQEANATLEQRVWKRTKELNDTVDELNQTLQVVNAQKTEIEDKNRDITASLNYAKRIQEASLTSLAQMRQYLPDSFVLFKPRDIVGGDFYCVEQIENCTIIIVADCTGHGVPGGFMSMLGINMFRQMVVARRLTDPAAILQAMNEGIMRALRQDETHNRDGMDAGICVINHQERTLLFAGARMPLYLLRNSGLITVKASRISLGGMQTSSDQSFFTHTFALDEPTQILLCSDGLQDQFGGSHGRKFLAKQIKELYSSCLLRSADEQRQLFAQALHTWMGNNYRQIDDILVMGARLC